MIDKKYCDWHIDDAEDFYQQHGVYPDPDKMPFCEHFDDKCIGNQCGAIECSK